MALLSLSRRRGEVPDTADLATPQLGRFDERVYAGVLGKILGVYMGRPVEGWPYERIRERFGTIDFFVSEILDVPLIVPDDDISGTFVFPRAVTDRDGVGLPTSQDVANTWLSYLVEGKTVLWWGGLARSTEHTAYLRLRDGIQPPRSGSAALNGRSMAEGIGAQIFIDGWALSAPGDPGRAAELARTAAQVSHDGFAVEAAAFIAAMEAAAFLESNLGAVVDAGLAQVMHPGVRRLVEDVVSRCVRAADWREIRDWIERDHGYTRYPGNSPSQTNLAAVLMCLHMAGDDFQHSIALAASAGWDTDSNGGNVGCLNGVRLGLSGIDSGADLRGAVSDRMFVVSADGGECVSDAVRETRKLLANGARLRDLPPPARRPRFQFEFPGSVQGWMPHDTPGRGQALTQLTSDGSGLALAYRALARGACASAAVSTCAPPAPMAAAGTSMFEVVGSPWLYPTQWIRGLFHAPPARLRPDAALFIEHYGDDGLLTRKVGDSVRLESGDNLLRWQVPDTGGQAVYRLGLELTSAVRVDGQVRLAWLDVEGAPEDFTLGRAEELSPTLTPWTTDTAWLRTFVSSATHFAPDYTTTFTVSHSGPNGVVTTGSEDWQDYTVSSLLTLNMNDGAGVVARSRGHRHYYAGLLRHGRAEIVRRLDATTTVLAGAPYPVDVDAVCHLALDVRGDRLSLAVDGEPVCQARDAMLSRGGGGFVVERGSILADGFRVTGTTTKPVDYNLVEKPCADS